MSDSQQQPITFQSKFAARKAQEDKTFMGLYSGSFQNRISGDLRHIDPAAQSNQTSITQEGTWERQRLTSTQNVVQKNTWGMSSSYVEPSSHPMASQQNPASQHQPSAYQPLNTASYTGKRLVGSSSNSGLSHNQPGAFVDIQYGRGDYRGTMEKPASQSLNYDHDHESSRYGGAVRPGSKTHVPNHSGAGMRGRSSDAVDFGRNGYRFGQDAKTRTDTQSGLTGQKINGHATYDLYNYGRENQAFQDVFKHKGGRNDSSLDHVPNHEQNTGLSASVGKPSLGGYGYSAGPGASRKLDYAPDTRTAPFEMNTGYAGRNSNMAQTNDYNRVSDKYGNYRANEVDKKENKNYEEVTDGYTEYFSQGCDYNGQLGHGQDPSQHDRNRHVNTPKSLSFDILIRTVSCGGSHTLILSKQGELFSIGSNEYGQLGLNDRQLNFTTAPLLVQEIQGKGLQVKQIASGQNHSLILTQNGQVFSWGSNIYGQCGLGKPASGQNSPSFVQGECDMNRIYGPQRLRTEHLCNDNIKDIAAGENFSGFLTPEGDVFTFGDNAEGQLGIGSSTNSFNEPKKVKCDEKIAQMSLGYQHMLLLTFSGRVLGAGRNREHQLGMGSHHGHPEQCFSIPVRIDAIRDVEVLKVIAGGFSAALIQNAYNRQLLVWGQGDFGIFEKPQKLYMDDVDFVDIQISRFSTNNPFALAIEKNGKVYSWGSNTLGQLGHGDQRVRKLPTQIQSLKRKTIKQLSIGHNYVVMLGRDVSQAEQQKKKLKRKMQKEAKERERQQRNHNQHNNKTKHETQDENRRPITNINGMDDLLSKERDYERRDSNQPATPKLPGESARESLGLRSGGNGQESVGRTRPKSANHVVRGIIDEMEKISNKGQGLLDRVKNLKEAQQCEGRSSRSPYSRERDPMRSGFDRGMQQDDLHLQKSAQTYGPTKSASFGETATDHEYNRERQDHDYKKHYAPTQSYMDNPSSNPDRRTMVESMSKSTYGGVQQQGYQPMTLESNNNRYTDEIEDLRRQLRQAKDTNKYDNEIQELKHQLQRANQENQQLREDHRKATQERDQEMIKNSNQMSDQTRQVEDLKENLYQKDRELSDLRAELGEQRSQTHEAKRTIIDQESKIKQVEQSYDQLQATYESKIKELDQEKMDLGKELDDAAMKNQQLMTIVKQKQVELHETQKIADQAKTMKKQLGKLEEIIDDLQAKNKELNELLNKKMIERAESYKKQVVDFLNKPKAYEADNTTTEVRNNERSEVNTQYKRLQEELDREQMTHIQSDRQAPNRRSYNDKSFQDYRKEQTFASEYGRKLNTMNNSIHQQDKENSTVNRQMHNSEKKKSNYVNYNPVENGREQLDQSHDFGNNGAEQKTRSVPRYSKINKLSSSPFFHNERRNTHEDNERERFEHGRRDELKSDYQRNKYPLGHSMDGPINHASNPELRERDRDLYKSRNDGQYTEQNDASYSYQGKQYYDNARPQQNTRQEDLDASQDDCRYPKVVSTTVPRERAEADGSRSRYDPDQSLGRPPLTGQRYSERDREQSAERKHSRVRSGHNVPAHSSSRVEGSKHMTASHNLNDSYSRNANEEPTGVQSDHRMSHQRSNSERRYSGERPNYPKNNPTSNRDGSGVNSREGLSVRSRDLSRGPTTAIDRLVEHNNTSKSKTRKEYVDITDCSDNSDKNRKVHRIDLAPDDQEDIQKQIQQKLTRIQKIFQGQQQRQGEDNTTYSMKDPVTSGARLNDDDGASFNERISMHTKDRTPVESQSFTGRPIDGAKTPVTASLTDLNGKDGGHNNYIRMASNPASAILRSEDQKKGSGGHEYDSNGGGHQRRKSLSHNPASYGRDHEVGSRFDDKGSYRQGDTSEFGQQQNYRPGEMRYTQDDLHDIRD